MRNLLALGTFAVMAAGTGRASADEDDFDARVLQLGVGIASVDSEPRETRFAAMARLGVTWRTRDNLFAGGFLEAHTIAFDTFDASVGPQLQLRPSETSAIQIRAGVGSSSAGSFATGGVSVGNLFAGVGVTARRAFDGGTLDVSVTFELQPLMLLIAGMLRD
jgi:hypothetical protein